MTDIFKERFVSLLYRAVQAEEVANKELATIVKNMIRAKIIRGDRKWVTLDILFEAWKSVAQIEHKMSREEKDLMSEYEQIEPYIDRMNSKAIYTLMGKLRGRALLRTIFETIRQAGPNAYQVKEITYGEYTIMPSGVFVPLERGSDNTSITKVDETQ